MVTVLWAVFGLVVIGLVLWYGGIIGGGGNGGGDIVTQEDSAENGNGEDTDATADDNGNGENGEVTADENGNGDDADDQMVSVFTAEQAERGQEAYSQQCAECHGGQLDGDPPLTGGSFASTWEGMPVNALYEVISQTMPQDSPGSLDEDTYNDVTAHILAFNGMPDGDSELQAGDSDSMETLISFDGEADTNGDAQADAEADENGDAQANGDENGDAQADGEENGDAQAEGTSENGDDQAAGNGEDADEDTEAEAEGIELEDTADGQPAAGEGWIDLTVEPETATVNVLGPAGYLGQLQGGAGTITGLEPGSYVFTASLGNFSHRVDAEVRAHETVTVNLLINELAGSPDLAGGQQGEQNGQQNGDQDESAANGEQADTEQNGNDENGNDGNGANGDVEDEANGNGDDSESTDGNGNGDDAWYTEDQAETGSEDYSASCASCHGDDGTGGSDPPLADGALEGSFETVWELFDYTATEMPDDDPGSLDEETYVNIIAHLLAINDYPSGDEELEADEEQMSDMSLSNGNGESNGENGNGADEGDESANGDNGEADGENGADMANGEDAEVTDGTSAERGASMYASNCAMCHGQTLHGVDAPPLAGPVFMERWGGHPVDWLYFQAHTSMPPDSPGSLDDQAYIDIIVHVLAENGILEGDEEFVPDDLLLRSIIIGSVDQQNVTLENRIESLRRTLHEPFAETEAEDPETEVDLTGSPRSPVSFRQTPEATDDSGLDGGDDGNGEDDSGDDNAANGDADDDSAEDDNGEENGGNEEGDGTEDDTEAAEDEGGNDE